MATTTNTKSKSTLPSILSRPRTEPAGGEEAFANVNLGEFNNDVTLSVSEANMLLTTLLEARKNDNSLPPMPSTDAFIKTREYLQVTSRIRDRAAVSQAETVSSDLVRSGMISNYERAQLGTYISSFRVLCGDIRKSAGTWIAQVENAGLM